MKAIRKEPGKDPEIIEVENKLEALQAAVGGHIQVVKIAADACVICDEEWLLKGKPINTSLGRVLFGGTILAVGACGEEFCDMPQPEVCM